MILLWVVLVGTGQIPELSSAPVEIGSHLVAEVVTALALVVAGVGLFRDWQWSRRLYPVALGMLLYTVINSAGYYADLGETGMVGMFTLLTVATSLLILKIVSRQERPAGAGETQRGELDA